jgi:hypothetical protein
LKGKTVSWIQPSLFPEENLIQIKSGEYYFVFSHEGVDYQENLGPIDLEIAIAHKDRAEYWLKEKAPKEFWDFYFNCPPIKRCARCKHFKAAIAPTSPWGFCTEQNQYMAHPKLRKCNKFEETK